MNIIRLSSILLLFVSLYAMAMDRPADLQARIEAVKAQYNLSPNSCRFSTNKETVADASANMQLACLIAGFKDVYLANQEAFDKWDQSLKDLLPLLNVQRVDTSQGEFILFTPRGQRNGLLLALLELQNVYIAADAPVQEDEFGPLHIITSDMLPPEYNPYLIGTLLGYPDSDIRYYYVAQDFTHWYMNNNQGTFLKLHQLSQWSAQDKQLFTHFENNTWPQSAGYQSFLQDIKHAEQWLSQQQINNSEYLKYQIEQLQEAIRQKTNGQEFRWVIES